MDMKALLNTKIETNSKIRFLTNDSQYKDSLTEENNKAREKIEDINIELKKL